jgi:16S rRNA (cytidine1402-2'-O)-methyltransferase
LNELYPDAEVVAGREITKLHEEWLRGHPGELLDSLTERGEFTVVIQLAHRDEPDDSIKLDRLLRDALAAGASLRDSVDRVIAATGLPRRVVYQRALELRDEISPGWCEDA